MCEPATITALVAAGASAASAAAAAAPAISMAVGTASAIAGHVGQNRAAQASYDATAKGHQQSVGAYDIAQQQNNQAATAKLSERGRQAMLERGHLAAISADMGGGGVSDQRLEAESGINANTDAQSIIANRDNANSQTQMAKQAANAQTQSQLNSVKKANWMDTGLQIGGQFVNTWRPQSRIPTIG
jgi:hypothetical protein